MSNRAFAIESDQVGEEPLRENHLPLGSMVRAICEAASAGPEMLYEAMLKLALMVDMTAPTYGLGTWAQQVGERPNLKWAEGLTSDEIAEGEKVVGDALASNGRKSRKFKPGDEAICLVLSVPGIGREGTALYGRCVRPLTGRQAIELEALGEVAELAQSYVNLRSKEQGASASKLLIPSSTLPEMVFKSRAMLDVAKAVERIKDSDSCVLITGDSGTGKELVARAIHRLSRRSHKDFIPFNCTSGSAELIESMLFGHRKGAFTGAFAEHAGFIRAAEGGTLFLDEIGDLPLSLQPKLLRFLQEGEIQPLGESSPRKVNVRVVAATHKDLEKAVREGLFREDLYYRVASLSVHIPPLRERPEDTATLISHFLTHYVRRNDRQIAGITAAAIQALQDYSWPGNVRELAAEIERLVLYADEGSYISLEDISPRILPPGAINEDRPDAPENLDHLLEDFERRVITEALRRHDCNVARASVALGLGSRQTLYKKLKRLAIDVGDFLNEDTEPGLQLRAQR
jgi:transcriptional regulator with GAF, ATPase, and Fis domain